ncbi:MAG: permease [Candidatus Bipolaricaulia bacterium]
MNVNTVVMLGVFAILVAVAWITKGAAGLTAGFRGTADTFVSVWPVLLLAFGIAGFLRVVIPHDLISSALGPSSGIRGILIGWGAGAIMPGAPYAILPVAGSLLTSGAGIGPVMTMVLSAAIGVAAMRMPFEIAFIGWRFAVLRLAVCVLIPPICGLLAQWIARWSGLFPVSGVR